MSKRNSWRVEPGGGVGVLDEEEEEEEESALLARRREGWWKWRGVRRVNGLVFRRKGVRYEVFVAANTSLLKVEAMSERWARR